MKNKTELSFEERYRRTYRRIRRYFEILPDEKLAIAEPLIMTYAFDKCEVEDLQKVIIKSGTSEAYRNGEGQSGMKLSTTITAYLKLQKNMQTTAKKLLDIVPYRFSDEIRAPWTTERWKAKEEFAHYIIDADRDENETFEAWRARKKASVYDPEDYYEDFDDEDTDEETDEEADEEILRDLMKDAETD